MKVNLQPFKCNHLSTILTTVFMIILLANTFGQSNIYIDPTYTGTTQNGTIQYPFTSWNSVTWISGNNYYQKAGTTFTTSGSIIISSKNNVTIGSYGTGNKPRIVNNGVNTNKVLDITSCSNFTISNLELSSTTGQVTAAILIDGIGSANNLIDNCILHDVQWGIRILTTSPGNRILNCEVYNTKDDGIYIKDTPDIEIGYCNVHDVNLNYFINPDQSFSAGDNIQIASTNSHNFNIHHNLLDHSSTGNKFCFIAWGNNYTGILEHNTFIGNANNVTSCLYLSPTTGNVTVRYNSIKNGNYGIYAYVTNFHVYYNNFVSNRTAIAVLNNYHLLAENNVFYNNVITAISALSGSTVISKNNIFHINGGKAYSVNSTLISDYNTFNTQASGFINGNSTLAGWQNASGQDSHSFVANPLFTNPSAHNFSLQPNSPCINAGTLCGYSQDFFGNTVPQGNSSDIGYFELSTTNPNQSPIILNQSFSVLENSPINTIIGTVIASDPNSGDILTYSISGGNSGNIFSINQSTGAISLTSGNLNHEAVSQYQLTVTVTDQTNLSSTATITIQVLDVNENPSIDDQGFNVNENSPTGTIIGSVVASDPDNGQSIVYSIISGNVGNAFSINQSTGVITVANASSLNFEALNSFSLMIKVVDNGNSNLNDMALITVTVLDINEAPSVQNQNFTIASTAVVGTLVGQIIALDPDNNQAIQYLITSGNTLNTFSLNSITGMLYVNNTYGLTNYNQFNLSVSVSDNGNPSMTSQLVVQINVQSSNNAPFITDNQSFNVLSTAPNGTIIGTVLAGDPDAGQILSYQITSGNIQNAFGINSSTGQITVANQLALRKLGGRSLRLTVMVTDNGVPSLSTSGSVLIKVLKKNYIPDMERSSVVYPNPSANGMFNLSQKDSSEGPIEIMIMTINGNLIQKTSMQSGSTILLDLSNQPKGTYILHSIQNGNSTINKLIIQ